VISGSDGDGIAVLLIAADGDDARLLEECLEDSGLEAECRREESPESGVAAAREENFDAVLMTSRPDDAGAADSVRRVTEALPEVPVVVLTGGGTEEAATEALESGASEHLARSDLTPVLLARTLRLAVERRRLDQRVRSQRALTLSILHSFPDHVGVLDPAGEIRVVNEAWAEFARCEGAELRGSVGENYMRLVERAAESGSEAARVVLEGLEAVLGDGERHFSTDDYPWDGPDERRWFRMRVDSLRPDRPVGAVVAHIEVTERVALERELEHRSLHDRLTGLAHRAPFFERLADALERARRKDGEVGVLLLDIDRFGRINDEYGHVLGDAVLRQVAARMESVVGDPDVLARLGDDEFGVLIEDPAGESEATETARRLTERLRRPVVAADVEVPVRVSCGIAVGGDRSGEDPDEPLTPDELVRRAGQAVRAARERSGPSFRVHAPDPGADRPPGPRRETELRAAIEDARIRPHYQPIVRLEDGALFAAEALARWTHPSRGPISPAEFIPLAEETGTMVELGRQVTEVVLDDLAAWKRLGIVPPDFQVYVNVSARQLQSTGFVSYLEKVFERTGVDPSAVCFEVTESVAMQSAVTLGEIQRLGSSIAVDNFGTESATLQRLAELGLDALKLDGFFVGQLGRESLHEAILEVSLGLAQRLDVRAIAEGVETEEQREGLLRLGCPYGQGFFFAAAVRAEDFSEWLEAGEIRG